MPIAEGIHYSLHTSDTNHRPPLILIHGAGGSLLSWHPYQRHLQGQTVYTLDLPGHGGSIGPGRTSIDEYADDVCRFMDITGVKSATVAGHSMGSAVALMLALKHPERVSALALVGGGAKLRVGPSILEAANNPATFESAVDMINTYSFHPDTPKEWLERSKQNMMQIDPAVLQGDFLACNQFDVIEQLPRLVHPTLILCGSMDVMTPPKFSRYLKDTLINSELHILKDAGHMVMLEQPDMVAGLLKQFMDTLPPLS
ncbi:MAG: alpha/beta hydrolase [Anaerolineales bacterium]|nr:alpha/beta hydrolase [Anaerolineales bacterium]